MRRFAKYLILTAGITACDSATKAVAPDSAEHSPAFAAANSLVDPGTLIPVPPEGAVCRADGPWTICHTEVSAATVNEPVLDLTCGTVYETGTDIRQGIRWYNDENKLVKRVYTRTADATWSLSPEGAEPTITVTARDNWYSLFAMPGDLSTESGHTAGEGGKLQSPGLGVIAHVAGIDDSRDTQHHGILVWVEDPAVIAELCAALTR
jgi:hypothetical protein